MKRRASDDSDRITEADVKKARIPWWKAFKLFLMNLPLIAKIVMLIIGVAGGTIAAPEAINLVDKFISKPLPTPSESLPPPPTSTSSHTSSFQGQVTQSITALTDSADSHSAELDALKAEIRALEQRVSSQRAIGDNTVSERVTANENEIKILKGIVQP